MRVGVVRCAGALAAGLALAGCAASPGENNPPSSLAKCGSSPFLTVSPTDPTLIDYINPLGAVEPSGHVFPSDHIYFYPVAAASGPGSVLADVVAPGHIVITVVTRQIRSGGGQPDVTDYAVRFFPCADVYMYFGHVVSLSSEVSAKLGTLNQCETYSTGGFTVARCSRNVEIPLEAGAKVGTLGGTTGFSLDYGGYDRRVPEAAFIDPGRSYGAGTDFGQNRTICPLDYFVPAVAAVLRGKLGLGAKRRTVPPVCGTIMQDVANTAQGRWYFDNTAQEDPHLSLIHDSVDPSLGVISVGTSVPSLPTNSWVFVPIASGRVNRDFPDVTADGHIYCYENFTLGPPQSRHILLQLTSPTTVRIEGVSGNLCASSSTWAFSAGARDFAR